jgi:hypothetical protein
VLLIVVLGVVAALVGTKEKKATTKPVSGLSAESTAPSAAYPGKQAEDHVADAAGRIRLSGFTVTVPKWEKSTEEFGGRKLVCGTVSLLNRDSRAQRYSEFDWRVQSPNGDVKNVTITMQDTLGTGDLISNGTKAGRVCFEDPGVPGQYVAIWKPDVFNAARGIWLFNL